MVKKIILLVIAQFTLFFEISFSECLEGDCNNGFGKFLWDNGTIYEGSFKNNYVYGKGKYTFTNGDTSESLFYDGKKIGREIYNKGANQTFNFRAYIGEFSGDSVTYIVGDDGQTALIELWDSSEKTFFYNPDGSIIPDKDQKSEFFDRWYFNIEKDKFTFPLFGYESNREIKSYETYDFFVNKIDYYNLDHKSIIANETNRFYEDLSKYLVMLIEGKQRDFNKKIFDRKISKEEYLCIEEYTRDIFKKDCGNDGYYEIFQYFKFYFTSYAPDWRINNFEFKNEFINSIRYNEYVNTWKFENLDSNEDGFIDHKEIYSVISNNQVPFWHHVYGYPTFGGYLTFLLYDYINSNEYSILSYEKKWELELVKAIPYHENHIRLTADNGYEMNEEFKKYDWNNDHIVTKDEYLKFSKLSFVNNEVGPSLYVIINNNFEESYYSNLDYWDREISKYKKKISQKTNKPKKSMCEMENELIKMDPFPWLYQWSGCGYVEKCISADQMMNSQYVECSRGNNISCQVFNKHLPDFKSNCQLRIDSVFFN